MALLATKWIEGWKAIADHLERRLGLPVSAELARHYARRDRGSLPVRRWGPCGRQKVIADPVLVDAWADRWWKEER